MRFKPVAQLGFFNRSPRSWLSDLLKKCAFAFYVYLCSVGDARAYESDLAKWVELPDRFAVDTNENEIDRWIDAGLARIEWRVYLKDGQVRAALTSETSGLDSPPPEFVPRVGEYEFANRDTYLRTDDGWLVSFRRGEWGGALYWFSSDGKSNQYLGGQQVNDFLRMGHRILAIEGLSNRSLIELSRSTDTKKWDYKTVKLLAETPYVVTLLDDGLLLIVLSSSVVSLAPDGKLGTIMTMNYGAGEGANSLVLTHDFRKAYLGRRNYVMELNFTERRVRRLVPEEMLRQLMSPGAGETPEQGVQAPARIAPPAPDPSLQ